MKNALASAMLLFGFILQGAPITEPLPKKGIIYLDQPPHKFQSYSWLKLHILNVSEKVEKPPIKQKGGSQ